VLQQHNSSSTSKFTKEYGHGVDCARQGGGYSRPATVVGGGVLLPQVVKKWRVRLAHRFSFNQTSKKLHKNRNVPESSENLCISQELELEVPMSIAKRLVLVKQFSLHEEFYRSSMHIK